MYENGIITQRAVLRSKYHRPTNHQPSPRLVGGIWALAQLGGARIASDIHREETG